MLVAADIVYAVKYRTLVWWKAAALMLAETVSLGVRTSLVSTWEFSNRPIDSIFAIRLCRPRYGSGNYIGHCEWQRQVLCSKRSTLMLS